MKSFTAFAVAALCLSLLAWGCAPAAEEEESAEAAAERAFAELPILDEQETWPRIEAPEDVAKVAELRDGWIQAFADGDAEHLDFVFKRDAVMTDLSSLVGEEAASPDRFFELYSAELKLDGDVPIEYGNWGSYYANYSLTLSPHDGGETIIDVGRFMARLWRNEEGEFEVFRGPAVGDAAPEFALNRMDGSGEVQLADMRDKPTVLVFGSFT
jgi:hypothetical protein